jgi:hypothetical protein
MSASAAPTAPATSTPASAPGSSSNRHATSIIAVALVIEGSLAVSSSLDVYLAQYIIPIMKGIQETLPGAQVCYYTPQWSPVRDSFSDICALLLVIVLDKLHYVWAPRHPTITNHHQKILHSHSPVYYRRDEGEPVTSRLWQDTLS